MKEIKYLPYKLNISDNVVKFISKLDKKLSTRSYDKIHLLAKEPLPRKKKHILELKGNKVLCELAIDKIRFYYLVLNGNICVGDVEYIGNVEVLEAYSNHKSGSNNYPNQKKDIEKMKKKYGFKEAARKVTSVPFKEDEEEYISLSKKEIKRLWKLADTEKFITITKKNGDFPTFEEFQKIINDNK